MDFVVEVIGWLGAIFLIGAFYAVSSSVLASKSILYNTLNLVGALCVVINAAFHRAYPALFVNVVWAGIAVWAIWKCRSTPQE